VSCAITAKVRAKECDDVSIEVAMKGSPVEAHRIVGANTWNGRCEFRRAGRQESKVTGWHDVNVGFARQAICDASIA
jgi:hypothetical protein